MQSDHEIEQLLRKAPAPPVPPGLEGRLISQAGGLARSATPGWRWFSVFQRRSWAPALALFAVVAGLLTTLAFQQTTLNALKEEKERAGQAPVADTQSRAQEQTALNQEYELLQRQHAELQALRAEMAEIERLLAQRPQLAAENEALRGELSRLTPNIAVPSEIQEILVEARSKAERIQCVNNLKQIGLAARIFATEHHTPLPLDFLSMTNELSTPKTLVCPSDRTRSEAPMRSWEEFVRVGSSYNMLSPGVPEEIPGAVYVRCPLHNNVARADGSVLQLPADTQFIQRDGYWEVQQ